jgi:aspartyl-tRNA(Asn)/glutamyl-tRNA(Gln) amidotransferase subunit C
VKINKEVITKLSGLSKLKFNKEEAELISEELETDGIEPLIHMNEEVNNWREDKLGDVLDQEKALVNSPVKDSAYFKLPKVLDKN